MPERRTKIPFPTPTSPLVDGVDLGVTESTERWSEITLEDGTVIRVKPNVVGAIRIDGQYDPEGNPIYAIKGAQMAAVVSAPANLRKGSTGKAH